MTQTLEYRGYHGTIEPQEDGTHYGQLAFIRDLITCEADKLADLMTEFQRSMDDYLEDCRALSKDPDRPREG